MPKKSFGSDYEKSKRNPFRKVRSGKLRQRESDARLKKNLGRLKEVQGCRFSSHSEAVGMAADILANQPSGGLDEFFLTFAHVFFEKLDYQWGQIRSLASYWQEFVQLLENIDPIFAQSLLSRGYERSFRWLAFGHVQRLYSLRSQEPESTNRVEIYENAQGKLTSVGVRNNGDRFIIDENYYYEEPSVLFPGQWLTLPCHPDDWERFSRRIWVPELNEPLKPSPKQLVHETLLVNVGLPDDLSPISQRMSSLPFPRDVRQFRRERFSSGDEESEVQEQP